MSELQGLQSRFAEYQQSGVSLVAITVDPVDKNREVVERLGLDFPILSDPDATTITDWGLLHEDGGMGGDIARPATFIVDSDGHIAWRSLTDNWRVRVRPEHLQEGIAAATGG